MINQQEWQEMSPYGQYEEVEVVFPATANADIEVPHSLNPYTPEHIDYQVVRQNQPSIIYHDGTAERRPWQPGYIILRSNMANAVATLRLSVRHKEVPIVLAPVAIDPTTNELLDGNIHSDTQAGTAERAATIIGNSTPKWQKLLATASGQFLQRSGDDLVFSTYGGDITSINATNISSGTLADARLSANVPLLDAANVFTQINTFTGVDVGSSLQTDGLLRTRRNGNNIEFGHTNSAGYGSALGGEAGSGWPFLAFNAEHGTNVNTYRTRGIAGKVVRHDLLAQEIEILSIPTASADNQAGTIIAKIGSAGELFERSRTVAIGEWTNVTHSGANFTASAGTWTVESGDQSVFRYMLIGKTMWFDIRLLSTSTSAGMGSQLNIAIPGGFTAVNASNGTVHLQMAGTYEVGVWLASGTNITLFRTNFTSAFPSSMTNTFDVRFQGAILLN